ncbi:hypothetical protein BG005_006211 [Podila minutissima]|nr:hypothetical protein BG005_006211 [Podila minutissima]
MGTMNLNRSLSKVRKRKHRSDSDSLSDYSSSSASSSSSSDSSHKSHRRRSKKTKHKRRRRYSSTELDSDNSDISSVESDVSTSHSDVPLATQKKRREQARALQGSAKIRDMLRNIDKWVEKRNRAAEKAAKLDAKIQEGHRLVSHKLKEQQQGNSHGRALPALSPAPEFYGNHSAPPTPTGHTDDLGQDQLMAHGHVRSHSSQSGHVGSVTQNIHGNHNISNSHSMPLKRRPDLAQMQSPSTVRPAPGASPVVKMEGSRMFQSNGASLSNRKYSSSVMEDVKPPKPRVTGYKKVFEQTQFQMPVSRQTSFSVISLGSHKTITAAYDRRPRQFELNPFASGTRFENIAAASSLAGTIQFWDLDLQKVVYTIAITENRVIPYAEVIRWTSEDTLVAVSHLKPEASWPEVAESETAVTDGEVGSSPESQATVIKIRFTVDGTLSHKVCTINAMPHTKPIHALTPIMRQNHAMSFVTAGGDKKLFHWKFRAEVDKDHQPIPEGDQGLSLIHDHHKSTVLSMSYSHHTGVLYSGGKDSYYFGYDMQHQKVVRKNKFRCIYHILQNPGDPHLNLVTFYDRTAQFELMDERVDAKPILRFGYSSGRNHSSMSNPSWHQDGALFTSGTHEDGTVNVWDIRWNSLPLDPSRRPGGGLVYGNGPFVPGTSSKHPIHNKVPRGLTIQAGSPTQIITKIGGGPVIQALFHPTRNKMIFVNKDCDLSFHDYHLYYENLE